MHANALAIAFLLVCSPGAMWGATRTWSGAASNAWSNPANWNGAVPASGDDLVFPASSYNNTSTNDLAGLSIRSITIAGEGYRIGGNAIGLGAGGVTVANRFFVSILYVTMRFDSLTLETSQSWSSAPRSEFLEVGPVNANGKTLTLSTNSSVGFDAITGEGAIIQNSPGAATGLFSATFAGPVTVNAGTLSLIGVSVGNMTIAGGATLDIAFPSSAKASNSGTLIFDGSSHAPAHFVTTLVTPLNVSGLVNLGNATLNMVNGGGTVGVPTPIINNDGTDSVSGTFLGLPEGAVINAGGSSYRISYVGGSGNDVTLTLLESSLTQTTVSVSSSANPAITGQAITLTAVVTAPAGTPTGSVSFYDGGALLGTAPIAAGRAQLAATFTAEGRVITAAYSGAAGFATSLGSLQLNVVASIPALSSVATALLAAALVMLGLRALKA